MTGHNDDTIYSGSVTDFRRALAGSYVIWQEAAARYRPSNLVPPRSREVQDAYGAALVASGCAYALAAVLAVAEREFGHDVAARLALKADDILNNGDDYELNADVMPEGAS